MKPKAEKCKVIQVSFLHSDIPTPVITMDNQVLESVSSLRLLGVIVQSDLKWDLQVQQMISRASRRLYILSKLKQLFHILPKNVKSETGSYLVQSGHSDFHR